MKIRPYLTEEKEGGRRILLREGNKKAREETREKQKRDPESEYAPSFFYF